LQIIELADAASACVRLAPGLGGAITAFTWRGQPVLRPTAQSAFDTGNAGLASCYPLVPYSNRIRDGVLAFRGKSYALAHDFGTHPHAMHGVGWQRAWSVAEALPRRATLVLEHDAAGRVASAWPWSFRAVQAFELTGSAIPGGDATRVVLCATLTLQNLSREPFPFGLGWHPFFFRRSTTELQFLARSMWENDATQLPVRRITVPAERAFDEPRPLPDLAFDHVFVHWTGDAMLMNRTTRTRTSLAADRACRYLVVYAPPATDFVALEPVTHETDAFNRHAHGSMDTGFRTLAPGAEFSCTMRIAASALD
jgi:aldose 1-epimerase